MPRYLGDVRGLALVALLLAACGQAPSAPAQSRPGASTSAARTASPTATSTPRSVSQGTFAVFVSSPAHGQVLTIVGPDGGIYGKVSPRPRTGDYGFQPSVSTSNTAVYYLDGDSALMRLRPGGSAEHVRDLPGSSSVHAAFAVSPDDQRIAVSLLAYGPTPSGPGVASANYNGMKLYVEDLDGSHHVDLLDSATVAEWPVGWHDGDVVIAVGSTQVMGLALNPYPYFAFGGIHVADAASGARKATLCGGSQVLGLAAPAGVLCAGATGTVESDWLGKATPTGLQCNWAGLQPGGAEVACTQFAAAGTPNLLWSGGSSRPLPAPPIGWVGPDHLLLSSSQPGAQLYDVGSGTTQPIEMVADWTVGAIPGGL